MTVDHHHDAVADQDAPSCSAPICLERVTTRVRRGSTGRAPALRDVSLTVRSGEVVAVVGPPGSGTSTLLDLCGGLTRPDSGSVRICGRPVTALTRTGAAALRRRTIGYVLQDYNLVPTLTLLENAALPLELDGVPPHKARVAAHEALASVGLAGLGSRKPEEVTTAQRLRAAVARASAGSRRVLLVEEPADAVDPDTCAEVMDVLAGRAAAGLAVLVVTRDPDAAKAASRRVHIVDGELREA